MAGLQNSEPIAVIVPTLNEAENVAPLVQQVAAHLPAGSEIIIVDDRSSDGTPERARVLAENHPVRLIERAQPTLGLAGAVIAGARAARASILVVMDADLSHPPDEIPALIAPLFANHADMVIGSRYVRGGSTPGWPFSRRIMSRLAAALAHPLTGVHDSMCGFFAIRRSHLLQLAPRATGFKIAFETIVHGGRGLRVVEVPIVFRDRTRGASKMNLRIALLFGARWMAAALRRIFRRQRSLPAASVAE